MFVDRDSNGRISVCDLSREEAELLLAFATSAADHNATEAAQSQFLRGLAIQIDRGLICDQVGALFGEPPARQVQTTTRRVARKRANSQEPRHRHERLLTYLRRGDQTDIAERVGCSPATVSAILNGKQAQNTDLAKDVISIAEEYVARRAKRYVR